MAKDAISTPWFLGMCLPAPWFVHKSFPLAWGELEQEAGEDGSAGSPGVSLTSFLSSYLHGNQPQPSIHQGMLAGKEGSIGRGVWAVEQHCSQHHQAGAA